MTTPVVYGGLGMAGHGLGRLGLGGPQPLQSFALPSMARRALPNIAHLYDRNLVFKRTLGNALLIGQKPVNKWTTNAGYQPITLELAQAIPDGRNIFTNPSFEPSYATGGVWNIYNNGPEAATIGDSPTSPYDGLNVVHVAWTVANTSTKGIWQSSAGFGGWKSSTTYTVAWWARATGGAIGQNMFVNFDMGGQSNIAISNPALAATWQRYVFQITVGPAPFISNLYMSIAGGTGGIGTIDFDLATMAVGTVISGQGMALGDVIRLTEQGGDGAITFSGNVETMPEEQAAGNTHHQVTVVPWISELGDTYFNQTYATPVDVAQWVRDAVALTAHCSVSPISCPNTGIMATYDFQQTNALDAVHVAKQVAGANYFYFVDAQGVVWFQPVYTSNPATITVKKGADYAERKGSTTVTGMKNKIPVIGGQNPGNTNRLTSGYGLTSDPLGNQAAYGVRVFNPTPSYPTVTDQGTLDAIAASLGAQFDRPLTTNEIKFPALGVRLTPGRPGGLTMRYEESLVSPNGPPGIGGNSPVFVVQDGEVDGASQKVILGDIPFTDTDTAYEAMRVAQRLAVVAAPATATLPVAPPPISPPTVTTFGACSSGHTTYAEGGGVVTIATATFTTPKTGTVQVLGQIDARMIAWDNYVAAPRRAVRAVLSGGIFTGTWLELPFGLTRTTFDLSSASGISLPAGTYTISIQVDTVEYNQIEVFSSWAQCAVTA